MAKKKTTTPDFVKIIEKAFKAPWQHKSLWFYGVLMAIFAGGSTGSSYSANNKNDADFKRFIDIFNSVSVTTWITIAIIVAIVILTLSVIGLIVQSWSLSAIINGTLKMEKGESFSRKDIGKTGKAPVWGLIKLNFLIPLAIFTIIMFYGGLIFLLSLLIGGQAGTIFGVAVGTISILALIPFLVYYGIIWLMAARFVVIDKHGAFQSLKSAREMIKGRFWMTFLLSFVSGIISGFGGCLGGVLFIIFLLMTIGFILAGWLVAAIVTGVLAFIGLIILIIVAGYFRAFTETSYTLWWLGLK